MEQNAGRPSTPTYQERLWPGPLGWVLVVGLGCIAAIAFLPLGPVPAVTAAAVAVAALVLGAVRIAVRVEVIDGALTVGRTSIPVELLGVPQVVEPEQRRTALGPALDARTFVVLRSWIPGAVQVPVVDTADAVPAWFISSRRPEALAEAIVAEQSRT